MKIDKETESQIQELQLLEQNLQNLLMQKQAFEMELNETENALNEIQKTKDEVYKIVGQVMLKSSKESIEKELKQKKELIALRLKSIEKQETSLSQHLEKLREQVVKKLK